MLPDDNELLELVLNTFAPLFNCTNLPVSDVACCDDDKIVEVDDCSSPPVLAVTRSLSITALNEPLLFLCIEFDLDRAPFLNPGETGDRPEGLAVSGELLELLFDAPTFDEDGGAEDGDGTRGCVCDEELFA